MQSDKNKTLIDITFRSVSGKSLHDRESKLTKTELADYKATAETRSAAIAALERLGFEVTGAISEFGVSIIGTEENARKVFGSLDKPVVPETLRPWIDKAVIPPAGEFLK
jgi:hypothetical protein